jgi:hypothetical protein
MHVNLVPGTKVRICTKVVPTWHSHIMKYTKTYGYTYNHINSRAGLGQSIHSYTDTYMMNRRMAVDVHHNPSTSSIILQDREIIAQLLCLAGKLASVENCL